MKPLILLFDFCTNQLHTVHRNDVSGFTIILQLYSQGKRWPVSGLSSDQVFCFHSEFMSCTPACVPWILKPVSGSVWAILQPHSRKELPHLWLSKKDECQTLNSLKVRYPIWSGHLGKYSPDEVQWYKTWAICLDSLQLVGRNRFSLFKVDI